MKLIQFGSENGSTKAGNAIWPHQAALNELFFTDPEDLTSISSYEYFSIVFRVSGKNKHYEPAGPDRLKKCRGRNVLTIDLCIPQEEWEGKSSKEFGYYVLKSISACFQALINLALKRDGNFNVDAVRESFNTSASKFNEYLQALE